MGRKKQQEGGGPDQGWIVTFSDCMTLLLCFFVLLLTFSSFEDVRFDELAGAFRAMSYTWLEENPRTVPESMSDLPDRPGALDRSSIVPTERDPHTLPNTKMLENLDMDQNKDRTVFYLSSPKVFWAQGTSLTTSGKEMLHLLAKYMRSVPCRVVIGESSGEKNRELGLRRAWTVMQFFTDDEGLSASRFSLNADCRVPAGKGDSQGVLELSLMNIRIEE